MNDFHSPMANWFLNHDLQEDELRWQLQEFKEKGFKGVFVCPRDGMIIPYQSELWWEKFKVIVDCCEEFGLQVWLYDDDPCQSGGAGGKVFLDRPEYKARELTVEILETLGGRIQASFPVGRLVKAVAIRMEQESLSREWLDLTSHIGTLRNEWNPGHLRHTVYYPPYEDFGNPHWRSGTTHLQYGLDCIIPEGRWKICVFVEKEISGWAAAAWGSYTDLLNPKAVQYFIDLTHEKYAQKFGHHFGKLIPGIFGDEPKVIGVVAWTETFTDYFFSLFGYDILEKLPDLFITIDQETAQIRHDYRLALGRLFNESYVIPLAEWCKERGIISTGHLSPEEDPVGQTRYVPYLMSMLKQYHLPGTDLIAGHIGSSTYPLLHLGPKMASSAAHHMNKKGVLAEAFGANSWELDFKEMRKMADWLLVMGVTDISVHGQFYSIDGLRKKEAPPSLSYQSSHWPYFLAFSQYMSEMSSLLKEGIHKCPLLVYYPQASFSAYYPDRMAEIKHLSAQYGKLIHKLLSNQWDFDLTDEETLLQMSVKDGKLHGMAETYDVLLLANCDYLESSVAAYCEQFIKQGGKVWLIGEQPVIVQSIGGRMEISDPSILPTPFYSKASDIDNVVAQLEADVIRETFILDVQSAASTTKRPLRDIYLHERELAGKTRLFVMNALDEWREGIVHISQGRSELLRFALPPNGSLVFDICGDQVELPLGRETIALNEAAFKEYSEAAYTGTTASVGTRDELSLQNREVDLSDGWQIVRQEPNVLNLTHWHFWNEDPRLLDAAITAVPTINVLDTAGPDQANEHWAFSRFYSKGKAEQTYLVFDQSAWEGQCVIKVNGTVLQSPAKIRRYDVNNREVEITHLVSQGDGDLQLNWVEVHFPSGGQLLEPFRLYGDFRVHFPYTGFPPGQVCYGAEPTAHKKLLSWDEIGYPHYAGTMTYEKQVMLPNEWLHMDLEDGIFLYAESVFDVARLFVNGVESKTCYCDPFAWEFTALLQPGANRLKFEIANSPVSLFEGSRKKAGILGSVKLIKCAWERFGGTQ